VRSARPQALSIFAGRPNTRSYSGAKAGRHVRAAAYKARRAEQVRARVKMRPAGPSGSLHLRVLGRSLLRNPSRHEVLRPVSVAFGCITDVAGPAVGSTRSRLTQVRHRAPKAAIVHQTMDSVVKNVADLSTTTKEGRSTPWRLSDVCYRRNVFRIAARLCRVRHQDDNRSHSIRANVMVRPASTFGGCLRKHVIARFCR
jgi:hypothetical protein